MTQNLKAASRGEDVSGRSRFARNVAFAWGGHLVNIAAGFIMPRLISDRLGQTTLGIWDFAWSLVGYFGIVQLGLGGSVQRYVARYRAREDWRGLSRSVSTIGLFLRIAGWLAFLFALVTAWWILPLFHQKLGQELNAVQLVVMILGAEIAVGLMFTTYGGILVGCHRWDIQNTLNAACDGATTVGMIVAVLLGGRLPSLALVHFLASAATDVIRWRIAHQVCPELKVNYRLANLQTWLEQARFSAKNLIPRIAGLLSNQSLSILITICLGPAALAIYSRPRNLVRQVQALAAKFGYILIPTASSLQAKADGANLRAIFSDSAFFLSSLLMPVAAALVIFGDSLIGLWMGKAYICGGLMAIMALGSFAAWVQEPIWSILTGMNQHGKLALVRLAGAVCSATLVAIALVLFKWNLLAAAIGFVLPQAIVDGIITPQMACRRLSLPLRRYYWESLLKPLLCVTPYALCLLLARFTLNESAWYAAAFALLGMVVLASAYWRIILPVRLKRTIAGRLLPVLSW